MNDKAKWLEAKAALDQFGTVFDEAVALRRRIIEDAGPEFAAASKMDCHERLLHDTDFLANLARGMAGIVDGAIKAYMEVGDIIFDEEEGVIE